MLILGMQAKTGAGNGNFMTSRERCFEASFMNCVRLSSNFVFEEFNIRKHVVLITLSKKKKTSVCDTVTV